MLRNEARQYANDAQALNGLILTDPNTCPFSDAKKKELAPFSTGDFSAVSGPEKDVSPCLLPQCLYWELSKVIKDLELIKDVAFRLHPVTDFEAADMLDSLRASRLVVFGLLHGALLPASIAGAVYAAVTYRRGLLADAIIAHLTSAALILISVSLPR